LNKCSFFLLQKDEEIRSDNVQDYSNDEESHPTDGQTEKNVRQILKKSSVVSTDNSEAEDKSKRRTAKDEESDKHDESKEKGEQKNKGKSCRWLRQSLMVIVYNMF